MSPTAEPTPKRLRYSMSTGPESGEYPGWIIKEEDNSDTSCTLDYETAPENISSSSQETETTFSSSERKRKRGEEEDHDDDGNETDVEVKSESGAESVIVIADDSEDEDEDDAGNDADIEIRSEYGAESVIVIDDDDGDDSDVEIISGSNAGSVIVIEDDTGEDTEDEADEEEIDGEEIDGEGIDGEEADEDDDDDNDMDAEMKYESGAESVIVIQDDSDDGDDSEDEDDEDEAYDEDVEVEDVEEVGVKEEDVDDDARDDEDEVDEDEVDENMIGEDMAAEDEVEEDVGEYEADAEDDDNENDEDDVEEDTDEIKADKVVIDEMEIDGVTVKKYNHPEDFFCNLSDKISAYLYDCDSVSYLMNTSSWNFTRRLTELQNDTDRFTLQKVRETLRHCRKTIEKFGEKVMICNAMKADLLGYGTTSRTRWGKFMQLVGDQMGEEYEYGRITMNPGSNSNRESLVREITRLGDVYECHRGQLISIDFEITYCLEYARDLCPLAYAADGRFSDAGFDGYHSSDSEASG